MQCNLECKNTVQFKVQKTEKYLFTLTAFSLSPANYWCSPIEEALIAHNANDYDANDDDEDSQYKNRDNFANCALRWPEI